ncbi:hypothetical protein ELH73_16095 [Rhizobium leguminosarum]|uniref:Propionyl-coenzyme A carboxylase alpha polypeptide n=1 Tax=Rhizobium leguminosarum TaxID=384 RepID=A0ABD7Q382_RHILE|nr:hypothetical protein ELI28_16130 [Rhizobium leguminosarum]TAV81143.1 hypothetical protein ELI27_16115 [Rhizobium leguminosarum]TAW32490.1 hypothetical protein ELI19_15885 [Rhizobium leguminosarum]TAW46223.1 hypothetical protein ELI18_15840 [Rhizobium leguminosarum]TAX37389.1 hypothetical protein ELI06_16350 [Rhizobium leguminosarum]
MPPTVDRDGQRAWSERYPPLSCRTSPPQGGRSARRNALPLTALKLHHQSPAPQSRRLIPISPLVGQMSGRTEGGDTRLNPSVSHP